MADAALTRVTPQPAGMSAGASATASLDQFVGYLRRYSDIALALGVICILMVLLLPMPKWLLDFSLALSITFSVLILMTALFISRPLDFSSFPTVLLIATSKDRSLCTGHAPCLPPPWT